MPVKVTSKNPVQPSESSGERPVSVIGWVRRPWPQSEAGSPDQSGYEVFTTSRYHFFLSDRRLTADPALRERLQEAAMLDGPVMLSSPLIPFVPRGRPPQEPVPQLPADGQEELRALEGLPPL